MTESPPAQDPSAPGERPAGPVPRGPAGAGRRLLLSVLAVLPLLSLAGAGLWGVDFGRHWDEHLQATQVAEAIEQGRLLPGWYNYPSMCFVISFAALAPEVIQRAVQEDALDWKRIDRTRKRLSARVKARSFGLTQRTWFIGIGALAALWVFLAVAVERTWLEALLAASLLAGSWEVGYHLRWIAPDAILMQFGILTLWLATSARRGRPGRLVWAAVAAGLGTSTKYTGGLLLLPVLLATYRLTPDRRWPRPKLVLQLLGAFALAYIVITPGTLLEPEVFLRDVNYEMRHYREGGHYGFSVEPGAEHLARALDYVGLEMLAPWRPLAGIWAALALLGAIGLARRRDVHAWIWLLFPVLYFAYFGSMRVLFVRNLLVLAPFLAVLAARGAAMGIAATRKGWPRWTAVAACTALVLPGSIWQWYAAETIRQRDSDRWAQQLAVHLETHPDRRYRIYPAAMRALRRAGIRRPNNVVTSTEAGASEVDALVMRNRELRGWGGVWSNRPGFAEAIFGPLEVNFDYYTTWAEPRLVVVDAETAREMGIPE